MSLVANDIWGAAVLRRMASSIRRPPSGWNERVQTRMANMHRPGSLSHAGIHLDGLEGGDVRECV